MMSMENDVKKNLCLTGEQWCLINDVANMPMGKQFKWEAKNSTLMEVGKTAHYLNCGLKN